MTENIWPKTISSFLVGVGVGGALALLLAPKSGEDTREYLLDNMQAGTDAAFRKGQHWARRAQRVASQTQKSASRMAEDLKDAILPD
ncbi:MAG TPA: YtxH domain-containing protein [Candidatus Acidoferrales bacterium]|nr:YtxH domain-containing protein [Candidatus Acidoferrales bacterium]